MEKTLDMQSIRYLNLFGKITRVNAEYCFCYNSTIIFVVHRQKMAMAIGEDGANIKKLSEILGKKAKVVAMPRGREDIAKFILAVIYPMKFKNIEITGDNLIINAGRDNKAAIIGRNKSRLLEMEKILAGYFGIKEVRIA